MIDDRSQLVKIEYKLGFRVLISKRRSDFIREIIFDPQLLYYMKLTYN